MGALRSSRILAGIILLLLVISGIYFLTHRETPSAPVETGKPVATSTTPVVTTIGHSVQGRPIEAYTYGTGGTRILFVGGMAGGYEWNGSLLAFMYMDYLKANPGAIPENESVTVIPELNVDGVYKATGKVGPFAIADVSTDSALLASARPNANGVDLNRNFDCNWKPTSMWQEKVVSAGTAPFSEPETIALRDFVRAEQPVAAIFWHSQAGGVYGAACNDGILPSDTAIMNAYAKASGYPAVPLFTAYDITGDSEGWLSSIGVPALTIELTTHSSVEWEKNLAGSHAILEFFRSPK